MKIGLFHETPCQPKIDVGLIHDEHLVLVHLYRLSVFRDGVRGVSWQEVRVVPYSLPILRPTVCDQRSNLLKIHLGMIARTSERAKSTTPNWFR